MLNPRRNAYNSNTQNPENLYQFQQQQSLSITSVLNLLKKPLAFPLLLSIFIFLTWVSLKFQHPSNLSTVSHNNPQSWSKEDDLTANLVRFLPSKLIKDKRGWLVDPIFAALDAGISGGAVTCASVHVGEIRPGGMRGNHRHNNCNETFILWGARIKFRLENSEVADKGYAEVVLGADEVAVAASPSGTAHALVNIDSTRTAYLLGCQDDKVTNSSNTAYKIWSDL